MLTGKLTNDESKPSISDQTGYVIQFDRTKGIGTVQCDELDQIVTLHRKDLGTAARWGIEGSFLEIAERIVLDVVNCKAVNVRSFKFSHCNGCGEIGHYWKECTKSDGKIQCHICGKRDDHKSKSCPRKLKMKKKGIRDGCFICYSKEHRSAQCPKAKIKRKTLKCSKCQKDGHHALTCGYRLLAGKWFNMKLLLQHPEVDTKGKYQKKRNNQQKKKIIKKWLKANEYK